MDKLSPTVCSLSFSFLVQGILTNTFPWNNGMSLYTDTPNLFSGHHLIPLHYSNNNNPGSYNRHTQEKHSLGNKYQTVRNTYPDSYPDSKVKQYKASSIMKYNKNSYGILGSNRLNFQGQRTHGNYGNSYPKPSPQLRRFGKPQKKRFRKPQKKRFGKPQKKKFYWPYYPYSASDYGNPLYKKGNEYKTETYDKPYADVPYEGSRYQSV